MPKPVKHPNAVDKAIRRLFLAVDKAIRATDEAREARDEIIELSQRSTQGSSDSRLGGGANGR